MQHFQLFYRSMTFCFILCRQNLMLSPFQGGRSGCRRILENTVGSLVSFFFFARLPLNLGPASPSSSPRDFRQFAFPQERVVLPRRRQRLTSGATCLSHLTLRGPREGFQTRGPLFLMKWPSAYRTQVPRARVRQQCTHTPLHHLLGNYTRQR